MRRALLACALLLVGCDETPAPPATPDAALELASAPPPAAPPPMEPLEEARLPEGPATELSLPALRERIRGLEARGDTDAALADMDVFVYRFAAAPSTAHYREVLVAHGREPRARPPIRRARTAGPPLPRRPPQIGRPMVRVEAPNVRGSLDRMIVRRILLRQMSRWRYCYERTLQRTPDVRGRVTLRFPITATGQVPAARVGRSTLGSPPMHECLISMARRLRFPTSNVAGVNLVDVDMIFQME